MIDDPLEVHSVSVFTPAYHSEQGGCEYKTLWVMHVRRMDGEVISTVCPTLEAIASFCRNMNVPRVSIVGGHDEDVAQVRATIDAARVLH